MFSFTRGEKVGDVYCFAPVVLQKPSGSLDFCLYDHDPEDTTSICSS